MEDKHANEFINRMLVIFGAPDTPDPDMFFDEYRAILKGTAPHLIKAAGDVIRDTHERKSWPVPGEVKSAIRKAAAVIDGKRVYTDAPVAWGKPSKDARARVDAMVSDAIEALKPTSLDAAQKKKQGMQKPEFEALQEEGTQYLHRNLTSRSRAMSGETQ